MIAFVHQYPDAVSLDDGRRYGARVYAAKQPVGPLFEAWFVFFPLEGRGAPIATDRETTQSKLVDVVYWASGISPTYLEGALKRALEGPPITLARHRAHPDHGQRIEETETARYAEDHRELAVETGSPRELGYH